jgi:hypothetical protein
MLNDESKGVIFPDSSFIIPHSACLSPHSTLHFELCTLHSILIPSISLDPLIPFSYTPLGSGDGRT